MNIEDLNRNTAEFELVAYVHGGFSIDEMDHASVFNSNGRGTESV
jgi:hypothetical protein